MDTFKRKIYNQLRDWKERAGGRRALMIKGARRVGKSTVVEEFAKKEYRHAFQGAIRQGRFVEY